jgi:hypothetical protein
MPETAAMTCYICGAAPVVASTLRDCAPLCLDCTATRLVAPNPAQRRPRPFRDLRRAFIADRRSPLL